MKKAWVVGFVLAAVLLVAGPSSASNDRGGQPESLGQGTLLRQSASQAGARPNFLIIISDNQRWDAVEGYMSSTWSRIFQAGTRFTNAYATTPNCCPSRASILTGMYAHNHAVRDDSDPLTAPTFIQDLHNAGYFTGQVGKYLNSWDGSTRPEFDFWVAFPFGGSPYYDPWLNVNGTWGTQQGYLTYLLRDYALDFLGQAGQRDQPFALLFAPTAPHDAVYSWGFGEPEPAPGDENLYPDLAPYRPPNFNEADVSDKPLWVRQRPLLTSQQVAELDTSRRKQLQTLNALDQAVGALVDQLSSQGKLDNTFVLYLSDNGVTWGEHRLANVVQVYDGAIRVPFAVRYPPLAAAGRVESRLVANIDIAPTIYELAGLAAPSGVDGRSLGPLLRGTRSWREELLIEAWPGMPINPSYAGVRTLAYYYVEVLGDQPELYNLERDPYLLVNRAADPAYGSVAADMRTRLKRLSALPTATPTRTPVGAVVQPPSTPMGVVVQPSPTATPMSAAVAPEPMEVQVGPGPMEVEVGPEPIEAPAPVPTAAPTEVVVTPTPTRARRLRTPIPAGEAVTTVHTRTPTPSPSPTPPGSQTLELTSTPTSVPTLSPPRIDTFSPTSGPPGTSVTIMGARFIRVARVAFGGTPAQFTVVSAREITAQVPPRARTGAITVTTAGGTASSTGNFTVTTTGGGQGEFVQAAEVPAQQWGRWW